ncbi:MAG: hypothetical protein H0W83_05825 [Planctomycetes bacterium]|nr:hypothetical protein [Planctomycetota bacterium]
MRPYVAVVILVLLLSAVARPATTAADVSIDDPKPLTADEKERLGELLEQLRSSRDPVLKLTPLSRVVDLGPAAIEAALPDLMPLLDTRNGGLRHDVLAALRPPVRLANDQMQRIERLRADPDESVRQLANTLMNEIRVYRDQVAAQRKLALTGQLSTKQLLEALGGEDLKKREDANRVVRQRSQDDPEFRREIAGQTAKLGKLARSPDASVRVTVMLLYERCFNPLPLAAVPVVSATAADTEDDVATAALAALAHAPSSNADAIAAARLAITRTGRVQGRALSTLATLGTCDDEILAIARQILENSSAEAWRGACAIIVTNRQRLPDVVERLASAVADRTCDPESRAEAMKAFAVAAAPERSIKDLSRVLDNARVEDARSRSAACTALMVMAEDARPALPLLNRIAKADNDDSEVRKAAKAAIEVIGRN